MHIPQSKYFVANPVLGLGTRLGFKEVPRRDLGAKVAAMGPPAKKRVSVWGPCQRVLPAVTGLFSARLSGSGCHFQRFDRCSYASQGPYQILHRTMLGTGSGRFMNTT